jgi:hypothetical protein
MKRDGSAARGDRHHRREVGEPQARDPPLRWLCPRVVRRVVAGPRLGRCGARIIGAELDQTVPPLIGIPSPLDPGSPKLRTLGI